MDRNRLSRICIKGHSPTTGLRKARPHEINGGPFDRFTLGHAAFGTILGLGRANFTTALALGVGVELLEVVLKDRFPDAFPSASQDTPINQIVDVAAVIAGWGLIQLFWPEHQTSAR